MATPFFSLLLLLLLLLLLVVAEVAVAIAFLSRWGGESLLLLLSSWLQMHLTATTPSALEAMVKEGEEEEEEEEEKAKAKAKSIVIVSEPQATESTVLTCTNTNQH
jgi:flagellar basal body-associated protein FliL